MRCVGVGDEDQKEMEMPWIVWFYTTYSYDMEEQRLLLFYFTNHCFVFFSKKMLGVMAIDSSDGASRTTLDVRCMGVTVVGMKRVRLLE